MGLIKISEATKSNFFAELAKLPIFDSKTNTYLQVESPEEESNSGDVPAGELTEDDVAVDEVLPEELEVAEEDVIPADAEDNESGLKFDGLEVFPSSEEDLEESNASAIKDLIDSLIDDVFFLFEFPYVDAHYRDSYYLYYSEKFKPYSRNTVRVHIFKKDGEKFHQISTLNNDNYYGFFIIRPLKHFPLGHSMISPKAVKINDFVCCLSSAKVSINGKKFTVTGFPHVAQDTETHTCAESSLWSMLNYFGNKYSEYKTYKPGEIIRKLDSFAGRRLLPSSGLSLHEITTCLNSCGQQCVMYSVDQDSSKDSEKSLAVLRIYVESGMPVLAALESKNLGHAVLVIGHWNYLKLDILSEIKTKSSNWTDHGWEDVSFYDKRMVFINDNFPPYSIATCSSPGFNYSDADKQKFKITGFSVPLQKHMFIDAYSAHDLVVDIFNNDTFGLSTFGGKWITRLFLTKSSSFKESILNDKIIPELYRNLFVSMMLPKFIWVSEIYSEESYTKSECVGIIILDPTSNSKSIESVLTYLVNDKLMENDGFQWITIHDVEPFKKEEYKHNLKGTWNKWKHSGM